MTTRFMSRLRRAIGASIFMLVLANGISQERAFAEDGGEWVLWKGSDQPFGDRMFLFCLQNGRRIIDLHRLKSFSEYVLDGKVNRVRFKDNQVSSDDSDTYRVLNVAPMPGTVCEWGMADQ